MRYAHTGKDYVKRNIERKGWYVYLRTDAQGYDIASLKWIIERYEKLAANENKCLVLQEIFGNVVIFSFGKKTGREAK